MNYRMLGSLIDLHKWYLMLCHIPPGGLLYYLPLITPPKPKAFDPEFENYEIGANNDFLLEKIKKFANPEASYDPTCVHEIFEVAGFEYRIYSEPNVIKSTNRKGYWELILEIFSQEVDSALFLLDPDIGIDLGNTKHLHNPEAYITLDELILFREALTNDDVLVCFQRLDHIESTLEDFLSKLKQTFGPWVFITGYFPHRGSFIFIHNDEETYRKYLDRTRQQYLPYRHLKNYKDLFILQGHSTTSGFFVGTDPQESN